MDRPRDLLHPSLLGPLSYVSLVPGRGRSVRPGGGRGRSSAPFVCVRAEDVDLGQDFCGKRKGKYYEGPVFLPLQGDQVKVGTVVRTCTRSFRESLFVLWRQMDRNQSGGRYPDKQGPDLLGAD